MIATLCPALIAGPALARDGGVEAVTTAAIAADSRGMLMAEARVGGGDPIEERYSPVALSPRDTGMTGDRYLARLTAIDMPTSSDAHALPVIPVPPAAWNLFPDRPRKSRLDAAPVDRMSLEGTADNRRRRNIGIDARLELRFDGREESAMVRLAGQLSRAIQSLERR